MNYAQLDVSSSMDVAHLAWLVHTPIIAFAEHALLTHWPTTFQLLLYIRTPSGLAIRDTLMHPPLPPSTHIQKHTTTSRSLWSAYRLKSHFTNTYVSQAYFSQFPTQNMSTLFPTHSTGKANHNYIMHLKTYRHSSRCQPV